jgi:hypothetical protein
MDKVPNKKSPTRRLTILYICALGTVALLAILGQIVIQFSIQQQESDALVINIAGRQRMLSQKISKAALIIEYTTDSTMRKAHTEELRQAVALWQSSQQGLQQGNAQQGLPGNNSDAVKNLFSVIEPNYEAMLSAANGLLSVVGNGQSAVNQHVIDPFVQTILAQESGFLVGMNQIVSQYQTEAEARVATLRTTELILCGITLTVLLLEGSFVFRPTAYKLNQTIAEIIALERANAEQKYQLEAGIQLILQTHVQTANGNFNARAPLTEDHVLWQIAYSLNNLLARLQRLSQADMELRQTKLNATRVVASFQAQANYIQNELAMIQTESERLTEALRDAKEKDRPISTPPSHTLLKPLYNELGGNYLQPALPPGRRGPHKSVDSTVQQ